VVLVIGMTGVSWATTNDDDVGLAFIEKARKLGIRNIAIHKGLPFGQRSYEHSTCVDVGRVAKRFPDVNFLIYHSGFVTGKAEGAYDEKRTDGFVAIPSAALAYQWSTQARYYAELRSGFMRYLPIGALAVFALGQLAVLGPAGRAAKVPPAVATRTA
jgi:hypothetical protein